MGKIAILTSGMGLGHYIPGVILKRALHSANVVADIYVYEAYRRDKPRIERTVQYYSSSIKRAQIGRKLYGVLEQLAPPASRAFLQEWDDQKVDHLVILSGQWCRHVLDYGKAKVHLLHMDADLSTSWEAAAREIEVLRNSGAREYWLFSAREQRVLRRIGDYRGIEWQDRPRSVVVHGGGWGIGELNEAARRLANLGMSGVIVIGQSECIGNPLHAFPKLRIKAGWAPWEAARTVPFPPLVSGDISMGPQFTSGQSHGVLDLLSNAVALVSKPGGGSLHECLLSATPLLFLEPWGAHEERNAQLWTALNLGKLFSRWLGDGARYSELRAMHKRLLGLRAKIEEVSAEIAACV
jgi:UDP-N-acetylglucosamine:LPS N-acetylglucosamine transferase